MSGWVIRRWFGPRRVFVVLYAAGPGFRDDRSVMSSPATIRAFAGSGAPARPIHAGDDTSASVIACWTPAFDCPPDPTYVPSTTPEYPPLARAGTYSSPQLRCVCALELVGARGDLVRRFEGALASAVIGQGLLVVVRLARGASFVILL